jgi:antitoxin MazE
MKTHLVKLGNSRGIRLPKPLIEQCNLTDGVNLEVKNHTIVISSLHQPREGWEEAFKEMHEAGDDGIIDPEVQNDWDKLEWDWK